MSMPEDAIFFSVGKPLYSVKVIDVAGPVSRAEAVLRLLILKHIRNWGYEVLEREGRANLVYRDFTRVGSN